MAQDRSATRRGYLKAAGAGVAALSLAGCTGGSDGNNSSGAGSNGTDAGGEAATAGTEGMSTSGGGADTSAGNASGNASGSAGDQGSIAIGSDIPYRPFEYRNNQDELVGFDVDIAAAVFGEQLGMTPQFQATSFDSIIPSLNNGNFRVIMSAMTINDERAEQVDFSDPYFTAYQTVIVLQNSDISTRSDLQGETIGVQRGTTGADAADQLQSEFDGDLTIQRYDQIPDAFNALLNNQVVAVVNDNTVNAEFVDENSDAVQFVEGDGAAAEQGDDAPPYLTLTVEEYGIAFRQDDDDLQSQVNDALSTLRDEGTYDEIYGEYFSG